MTIEKYKFIGAQDKAPFAVVVRQANQPVSDERLPYVMFGFVAVARLADEEHKGVREMGSTSTSTSTSADELAPHLKWVRICLADQTMVPLYESAVTEAGLTIKALELI